MLKKLKKTVGVKDGISEEKTLPSISVNAKDLPMVKDKKVDDEFTLVMKVKVQSISRPMWSKDKTLQASLDIIAMSPEGKQYDDYEQEYATRMSGK